MASASSSSGSGVAAPEPPPLEVPHWLKSLPLAPEFHPTIQEFQDPIAYILKIEKEAAAYGICKIVPPVPAAPKKTALANLNRSFAARDPAGGGGRKLATFTTRQQQIGFCPRRPRPVQKPVWQSGERYTLQQFETKAHQFERSHLRRATSRKVASADALSPLEVETLFWRASADKPFSVEYANDMPGSGFAPLPTSTRCWREEPPSNVGESAWNMRGVSRAKGSLLRFMKEEIPGVTSPMVYVAMLFSWFAWHVEDHELHSMNYLHMGAGKTWYGMPRDAGLAFEEVVRVHGYGEEVNPLVTFAILGEKTTVMSPEVLVGAGIPCCRLVQNAGDFVVTFPGAYHSGFSHGFNCGEAANIATPEWLRFAKEAAVRRASINYPPMVSHFHLLYALALSLCTRIPIGVGSEPRSSRLKDKMKGEGEEMVKNAFVQSVIQNNHLLNILLDDGTSCVVLPQNAPESPLYSNSLVRSQVKIKPRLSLGLCSHQEALEASRLLPSSEFGSCLNTGVRDFSGLLSFARNQSLENGKMTSSGTYSKFLNAECHSVASDSQNMDGAKDGALQGDGLLDQGLLSCVTCGILSFACVAIIQPTEAAAKYLISADCDLINDHVLTSGPVGGLITSTNQTTSSNNLANRIVQVSDQSAELSADGTCSRGISALDLLASVYADSSDIEDEDVQDEAPLCSDKNHTKDLSPCDADHHIEAADEPQNICSKEETNLQLTEKKNQIGISAQSSQCADVSISLNGHTDDVADIKDQQKSELSSLNQSEIGEIVRLSDLEDNGALETNGASVNCSELDDSCRNIGSTEIYYSRLKMRNRSVKHDICGNPIISAEEGMIHPEISNVAVKMATLKPLVMQGSDRDCSRMHVFCLEHAAEIEKQLKPIGGVDMMLLCHPDYPKIESEAKLLAKELGIGYSWKNIKFREANEEDQTRIKAALEDEEVMPMNSDWTVKLGINLYYTASLSKSPLYSKQMPYNRVIYKAFGCSSTGNSPIKSKASARRPGRQKKLVLAGRWCGKVWMSNQVHPYLAHKKKTQEQEQTEELYSHEADEKPLIEIDIDNSSKASSKRKPSGSSLAAKISGKKRKKPSRKTVNKKPRYTTDINSKDEDASGTCETPQGRTLRSSNIHYTESIDHLKSSWKDGSGGPSTRLRKRSPKPEEFKNRSTVKKQTAKRKAKKSQSVNSDGKDVKEQYTCDFVGCGMSFSTEHDLALHKHDICPVKDCGRKTSRKRKANNSQYANLVTKDEKQYTCDTEGCSMSFSMKQDLVSHQRDACLMKGCGKKHSRKRKAKNSKSVNLATKDVGEQYMCDVEGCSMTFSTKKDLAMHKREICLGKDCAKKQSRKRKDKNPQSSNNAIRDEEEQYTCNIEGCSMSFSTKQDLSLHKRDICPVKGCGKKFFSHKYLLQHRKVHTDDRPLVCPWKGCKMTFKWAWARTEHIRVHTGDRPYICSEPGCGQTFRFVSDFSRHKRKTGHSAKRARR